MPTLVATVGASNANSYVTQAAATTYLDERLNTSAWTDAASDDKDRALIQATRRIDQEQFKGVPVYPLTDVSVGAGETTQALKWPRWATENDAGWAFDEEEIPVCVQHATIELALRFLNDGTTDLLQDTGLEGFRSVSVGPVSVVPKPEYRAGELPENVRRLLRPVLVGSRYTMRVDRA